MSDKTYQDFINEGSQFGSLRFARKCRSILNSQFKYKRNNYGVFNDPEQKIKYYLRLQKDNLNIVENTIHIRLAGDGTHIEKNFSVLNFSFSFLNKHSNEEMSVSSVTGIFLLGVFKIKSECYTSLKKALKEHKCLETLDGTYGCTLDQNPNFKSYIEFLTQIGIRNPYWIEQKRFKLRILNGDEKRRLLSKMNLTILFPDLPHGTITNKLWKDMHTIMESLRADTLSVDAIQFKTNNWLESFLLVNFTTEVTPYIHAFSSHVHQQIKHLKSKDLSLNDFSMQSLEKFNDFSTQYFQRSTNKRDDIEVQIAKKRNF